MTYFSMNLSIPTFKQLLSGRKETIPSNPGQLLVLGFQNRRGFMLNVCRKSPFFIVKWHVYLNLKSVLDGDKTAVLKISSDPNILFRTKASGHVIAVPHLKIKNQQLKLWRGAFHTSASTVSKCVRDSELGGRQGEWDSGSGGRKDSSWMRDL